MPDSDRVDVIGENAGVERVASCSPIVLLLAGILLTLTGGLAYVAPFVYTLF